MRRLLTGGLITPVRRRRLPPARNTQFATSVERFFGLEHIGSHCFAAAILSL
jgi:hypothetical protein